MTGDALLAALADAMRRKEQAARQTRLLLAYARELTAPRPYRLADLAQAAGMSISWIRTAYRQAGTDQAAALISGPPACGQRRHIEEAVTALLADGQHAPAREHHTAA
jgi:AraC-like DNA-binding protein